MADTNLDIIIRAKDEATAIVKTLQAEIVKLESRLKELGGDSDDLTEDLDESADSAKELNQELGKAAKSADKLADEADDAEDELDDASSSAESLDQNLSNARVAAIALAAAVVAIGVAAFKATQNFFEFEKAVIEVGTLVDETVVSNAELRDTVRELAAEFGQDTTSVAQGLYQAISSGAEAGQDANNVLRASLVLAKGALVDTSTAVDVLTTATNSFEQQNLTAERASDILFATVKAGKTNLDELAASLAQVTPIAGAVGISFDEVNAAVAALTLGGTRTAQATTQIRAAIQGILRPTAELQEAFQNAGFASAQAALEQEGLGVAFGVVAAAAAGNQGELQKLVGSVEGVNAILQTTGPNAARFARVFDDITNSVGASEDAAAKVAATFQDRFARAINEVSIAFGILGEALAPIVTVLAEVLAVVVTTIGDFVKENQTLVQVSAIVVAALAAVVAAIGTLIISVIAVRGAIAFLSGSAGFPLVTTALRAMGVQALSTAGSLTTLGRVMSLLGAGLTRLAGFLRVALAAIFSLAGALVAVGLGFAAFIISTRNASEAVNELADSFEQASFQSRAFAQGATIRSIGALEAEVRKVGDASRANVAALAREIDLRKQQIELALEAARANLATQEAADTLFNDNADAIESAKDQVELFENQLKRASVALDTTQARLRVVNTEAKKVAAQGLEDAKKKAEAMQAAFEAAQEGTNAFFEDLQTLNAFKFTTLADEIEAAAELSKTLAEAGGADPTVLVEIERQKTADILAIKEQEIAQRIELEERRVARQSQLIADNVTDEVEAARQLQDLSREALASQIQSTQDLIGIRQTAVASVRQQLQELVTAAADTQRSFEAEIRGIDSLIRSNLQSGLTDAQQFQADQSQIAALGAQIRTAIANGELEDAKRIIAERIALIQATQDIQTQEAGFALESDIERQARVNAALESTKTLRTEVNAIEQARNTTQQEEALNFLERENQTIKEFQASLQELGSLSQVVNLQTNFADVLDNLDQVQAALTALKAEAGGIGINLVADQSIVDILTGTKAVQITLNGAEAILSLTNAFEQRINTALGNAERIANLLNRGGGGQTPGFAGGGLISGPGTGTSDSLLARISNGEFVMRKAAVDKFGTGFFNRLNGLRVPRFADGGAVGAIPQSRTTQDRVSISLNLNKQTFDLESDRDTARNMVKAFSDLKTGLVGG